MNPDRLAEMNPITVIVGFVVLIGLMTMWAVLANFAGPSQADIAAMEARRLQMDYMLQQQEMMQEMQWQVRSQIDVEQFMAQQQQYMYGQ